MKVVVSGATGLVGRGLIDAMVRRGDDVLALTRSQSSAERLRGPRVEPYIWPDPKQTPPPSAALSGADAVVHLLGEPVAQRWTERAKQEIRDSRVLSTRQVVNALSELPAQHRPKALVNASAIGYYGAHGPETIDESADPGTDFLSQVVTEWEQEATRAQELGGVRVALPRIGVVLAPRGGALGQMLQPFRLGLGGPVAGGRQYTSWVHLADVAGAILHCLDSPTCEGPFNLTAPTPVTNREFSKTLGRVLHRPAIVPVPGLALRALYGDMASVVTGGQRVLPKRLSDWGYEFGYRELEPALRDLVSPR